MDVIFFSSRGPSPGGRAKPDLVAPGTHVTGTRATPGSGSGICDATRPIGNPTYAAASGTSHSTPAVSAVASLAWWWIANGQGSLQFDDGAPSVPSPALMKAWLVAHPTYLTGEGANDDLPSNAQGFGMPDLEDMFSDTPNWLLNQTEVLGASGQTWSAQFQAAIPGLPVRIVLAWTDAAGAVGTSPQVNNLDLEVTRDSTVYHGNHFSGQWSTPGGAPDAEQQCRSGIPAGGVARSVHGPGARLQHRRRWRAGQRRCDRPGLRPRLQQLRAGPTYILGVKPETQSVCSATSSSLPLMHLVGADSRIRHAIEPDGERQSAWSYGAFSINPMPVSAMAELTLGNLDGSSTGRYRMAVNATGGGIRAYPLFASGPVQRSAVRIRPCGARDRREQCRGASPCWPGRPPHRPPATGSRLPVMRHFADIVYSAETQGHIARRRIATRLRDALLLARDGAQRLWRDPGFGGASFTTTPIPGECAAGTVAASQLQHDFEGGNTDWTTIGKLQYLGDSHQPARTAGPHSFLGQDLANISDQRLASPPISLPAGQAPLILEFWSHQTLEDRIGGCYDGALLEISTDDGISWSQVPDGRIAGRRLRRPDQHRRSTTRRVASRPGAAIRATGRGRLSDSMATPGRPCGFASAWLPIHRPAACPTAFISTMFGSSPALPQAT